MPTIPLTVDPDHKHTFWGAGSLTRAKAHLRKEGIALHLRADGSARLYWIEDGKRRQKTWKRFTLHHRSTKDGAR